MGFISVVIPEGGGLYHNPPEWEVDEEEPVKCNDNQVESSSDCEDVTHTHQHASFNRDVLCRGTGQELRGY